MSKEPWVYGRVEGMNAFLAGIVEGMAETRLYDIQKKYCRSEDAIRIDTDVFALEGDGPDAIKEAIKRRIIAGGLEYTDYRNYPELKPTIEKAESMEFEKQDISFSDALLNGLGLSVDINDETIKSIETLCRDLRWYIGETVNVYKINDRNGLLKTYVWLPLISYIFEFESYAVLFIMGSSD